MENSRGAIFLWTLGGLALLWGGVGSWWTYGHWGWAGVSAFGQAHFFTSLDLIALIVLFWKIFFSRAAKTAKKVDLFLWFSFKLVCLVFLAITLKRLNNAPFVAVLLGIGFIGVGPIAAGILCKVIARDKF